MKGALFKNSLREIKNTKARFISIMLIIALGVGFFAGIKATSPSMNQMAIDYYDDTNLMDFRVLSTVGFNEDDVTAICESEYFDDVMPSYFLDVSAVTGTTGSTIRLLSTPSKYADCDAISTPELIEGRMPQSKGEIAVESGNFSSRNIGEKITIEPVVGDTNISDQLNTLEFTVVGIVKSPMYISIERGTTTVGNGKIDEFAYITEDNFDIERYTVVYTTLNFTEEKYSPFSDEYEALVKKATQELESIADERVEAFNVENIDKAQQEIDDGWAELTDKKADTEKKLSEAATQLENGTAEYNSQISSAENEISSAQNKLYSSRQELDAGWAEYNKSVEEFNTQISSAKEQLNSGWAEYNEAYAQVEPAIEQRSAYEDAIVTATTNAIYGIVAILPRDCDPSVAQTLNAYAQSVTSSNAMTVLTEVKTYLNSVSLYTYDAIINGAMAIVAGLDVIVDKYTSSIDEAMAQLDPIKAQLESAQAELDKTEQETSSQLALYKAELENAENELYYAQIELENAENELESAKSSGLRELQEGEQEYKDAKAEAEKEFKKAEDKLDDAQAELDSVEEAQWYIFDRDDNPGYSGFINNTSRVDAVASVFPMFFLLVALLVCLTTMTRLVEEKRTEIGTLKALGYGDGSITMKFVSYACLAAVIGCALGCVTCIPILPRVIYNAYGMLYNMRDKIGIVVDKTSLFVAVIAAFACCSLVSFFVCRKNLRHKPATLMRPKTPKAGKRILLERITPLWKRFNFSSKVTWRNLFRYKSRLFMTAIGIAGCTALMLAAFGLYNSINDVCDKQFVELSKYNTIIVTDEEKSAQDLKELCGAISADTRFSDSTLIMQKSVSISSEDESIADDVYLTVAQDAESFENLITLRERQSQTLLTLTDDSAILTEKLADRLNVTVGDTVTIGEGGDTVTVGGIAENYVYNYIYMTEGAYTTMTKESVLYNTVYANAAELDTDLEKAIGADYLGRSDVAAISFTSTVIQEFKDMISSMNMIVLVMIISAGALAIVVLYNLTNINLAERNREIATIKVLGFNYNETSGFVYRENIILTLLGIVLGLVLGVWLLQFVINTIEMETVMFGRELHISAFVLASLLTAVFSFIVNLIMYFRIKAINMVESLKSIE